MKKFVLDCSVTMTWCFHDEASSWTNQILESLETAEALVPSIWMLEVTNVLVAAERKKRISEEDIQKCLGLLLSLPIRTIGITTERIADEVLKLAQKFMLSTYDASYLELAQRENISLVTLDSSLKQAAKKLKLPELQLL